MKDFEPYVQSIEGFVGRLSKSGLLPDDWSVVKAVLDGQPSQALRDLVPLDLRKPSGAFFTGTTLGVKALGSYAKSINIDSKILDPACGTGDLLVACARSLPLGPDLFTTVDNWGTQLYGFDVYPEFIRATKVRLALLAMERGVVTQPSRKIDLATAFPHIQVGNGITRMDDYEFVSHIVLNPPFSSMDPAESCSWATGKTSTAAIFTHRWLSKASLGTRLVAILPDVLRSGTNYAKWRSQVASFGTIDSIQPYGVFDSWADIDVFILRMVVGNLQPSHPWPGLNETKGETVGDYFDARIGPVVPFRDPKLGPWYPYLHARLLPLWETFAAAEGKRRRFRGTTFTPPFVVVRRTSRPGMKYRAGATAIVGDRPVAVENHLIVLEPKDKTIRTSQRLLEKLRDPRTNEWLDHRIRCRHLTVSALAEVPWWE